MPFRSSLSLSFRPVYCVVGGRLSTHRVREKDAASSHVGVCVPLCCIRFSALYTSWQSYYVPTCVCSCASRSSLDAGALRPPEPTLARRYYNFYNEARALAPHLSRRAAASMVGKPIIYARVTAEQAVLRRLVSSRLVAYFLVYMAPTSAMAWSRASQAATSTTCFVFTAACISEWCAASACR